MSTSLLFPILSIHIAMPTEGHETLDLNLESSCFGYVYAD